MQTKQDLEQWHATKDAWGYETNPEDAKRKTKILSLLKPAKRALDLGAGEGFITRDLPAKEIYAIEISDNAASRFPKHVKRIHKPEGKYDLIIATGVFYDQYNWTQMHYWIYKHANGQVLTSNIKSWEHPLDIAPVYEEDYPYREYTQHLCLYDFATISK